jgi:hypothetical protein
VRRCAGHVLPVGFVGARDMRGMVQEALAGGGARAAQFKRDMVDGVHYLELVEPIKRLKRDGRLDEAFVLWAPPNHRKPPS